MPPLSPVNAPTSPSDKNAANPPGSRPCLTPSTTTKISPCLVTADAAVEDQRGASVRAQRNEAAPFLPRRLQMLPCQTAYAVPTALIPSAVHWRMTRSSLAIGQSMGRGRGKLSKPVSGEFPSASSRYSHPEAPYSHLEAIPSPPSICLPFQEVANPISSRVPDVQKVVPGGTTLHIPCENRSLDSPVSPTHSGWTSDHEYDGYDTPMTSPESSPVKQESTAYFLPWL